MPAGGTDVLVEVAGGQLPVYITGSGGNALLFIHGWTLDRSVWRAQHAGLSDCARALSFDRRGFGEATAPPGLSQEPADLAAILDRLEIPEAWLVAQSQGTRVALAFALAFPDRVKGLVLQGTPRLSSAPEPAAEEIPRAELRKLALAGEISRLRERWLAHPLMHSAHCAVRAELARIVSRYSGEDLLTPDPGLMIESGELADIQCPVLLLAGERETAIRKAVARTMAACLPRAFHRLIPDAGHLCNLEQAAAFNEIIRAFIVEHGGHRTGARPVAGQTA